MIIRRNITLRSVLAAGVATGAAAAVPSGETAFTHATVIDPASRRALHDATVVVRGHRIVSVGRSVRVPAGTRVVDLRGTFVIPGLADMHVHSVFEPIEPPLFLANGVTTVWEMSGTPTVPA
jgi:imidazolonepropionase-like amidohydrolase